MAANPVNEILRRLPAVEAVLQHPEVKGRLDIWPRALVTDGIRQTLDAARKRALRGEPVDTEVAALLPELFGRVEKLLRPGLSRVLNATGTVLHTNLGRAPLPKVAVEAMARAAGYCNLEYNIEEGKRGHRHDVIAPLLARLTGAEAAVVVNNNAAAVLLCLSALAEGHEVVVSRGELVEIGGAFRIPDVISRGGAILREIGATNKTKLEDYREAVNARTRVLLKVHTSNFRVLGFTQEVSLEEMVAVARDHDLYSVYDLGSGHLVESVFHRLYREPGVRQAVASGVDVVTFSGDKLLGGPQAGIIVGTKKAVDLVARHPLMRALRPDKVTLAALEAVLALYFDEERAVREIPTLRMLTAAPAALARRAETLAAMVREAVGGAARVEVRPEMSEAGGGSLPLCDFPTTVVAVSSEAPSVTALERGLRVHEPPVIARIKEGALLLDPRTLEDDDFPQVAAALAAVFCARPGAGGHDGEEEFPAV